MWPAPRAGTSVARYHFGRHFQQGVLGMIAVYARVGGAEHPLRIVNQPSVKIIVEELFGYERPMTLHRPLKRHAVDTRTLLGSRQRDEPFDRNELQFSVGLRLIDQDIGLQRI